MQAYYARTALSVHAELSKYFTSSLFGDTSVRATCAFVNQTGEQTKLPQLYKYSSQPAEKFQGRHRTLPSTPAQPP